MRRFPSALRDLLYLVIAIALTSCDAGSSGPAVPREAVRGAVIAVIGPAGDHPHWPGTLGGIQRYFEQITVVRPLYFTPADVRATALLETVERALGQGPGGVLLYVDEEDVARPALRLLNRRQVPVVTIDQRVVDVSVDGHVCAALEQGAELLAEHLKELIPEHRSYVLVHDRGRSKQATQVYDQFSAVARRRYAPQDLRLLGEAGAFDSGQSGRHLVETLLGRFRHAALLITLDASIWTAGRPGWRRRLRSINSGFRYATLAACPQLWADLGTPAEPGIAAGLVGALDGDVGYGAAQLATEIIVSNRDARYATREIPCELVTAENLVDFARRYSVAANGLDFSADLPAGLRDAGGP